MANPILTHDQFYKRYGVKFGKPGSGAYTRYVKYVKRRRSTVAARRQDYLSPVPSNELQSEAKRYVSAQINPLIQSLYKQAAGQSARGQQAIRGLTNSYTQFLAPLPGQIAGIYDAAGQQANLANAVMRGGQQATANSAAGALAQSAQQIGAPASSQSLVHAAQTFGDTSTGLQAARGAAEAANIANMGAGGTAFAATLPGIARMGALQDSRILQEQINARTADQRQQLLSQIPSLTQDIYQRILDREFQKAVAKQSLVTNMQDNALGYARIDASAQQNQARINAQNTRARQNRQAQNQRAANAEAGRNARNQNNQNLQATKLDAKTYTKGVDLAKGYFIGKQVTNTQFVQDAAGNSYPVTTTKTVGKLNAAQALRAISAYLRKFYPNAPDNWVHQNAVAIVRAGGYTGYAKPKKKRQPGREAPGRSPG